MEKTGVFPLIRANLFSSVILETWEAAGRAGLASKLPEQSLFTGDFVSFFL